MGRFFKKFPRFKKIVYHETRRRTEYVRFSVPRSSSVPTPVHSSGVQSAATEFESIPSSSASSIHASYDDTGRGPLTRYQSKRQKLAEAWSALRANLLDARVEEMSPATHKCSKCCKEEQEIIRCLDCSTFAYYCPMCCNEVHQTVLFHTPQLWKGRLFVPFVTRSEDILRRKDHEVCTSSYLRFLCVIDFKGTQHRVKVQFCQCEKEAVTILRYGLWPATPELPKVAIHIDLMEQATMLQLEGQLSLRAFCDALSSMNKYQIHDLREVENIYRLIIGDCSNEYRYHSTIFKSGRNLIGQLDFGKCPPCSQGFTKVICMDANFGLVHKQSSGLGQGLMKARHENTYFMNQDQVDSFVDSYNDPKRSEGCSSFQAGNILRSKIKNSKLDVTGIFGSVCKHDFPLLFCNMRHGERLSYAVNLLENFIHEGQKEEKVIAIYDIACMLHKHLKKNVKNDILDWVSFCVPVFHSFAHNMSCQLQYGQRNVTGTGLTDGEGMERLWSYLRCFSKITKEMNLDNRQDLLVDALFYYSEKLKLKLCSRLEQKHLRAIEQKTSALESLKMLTHASMEEISQWANTKKSKSQMQSKYVKGGELTSVEKYCSSLFQFYQTRDKINALPENAQEDESMLKSELERLEKNLVLVEKKMKITERWTVTSENFQFNLKCGIEKRKTSLIKILKDSAAERTFLLSLMKKYADGQDIAIRVGRKLQQTNHKINQRLKELNELDASKLNFADVCTPSSQIYQPVEDTVSPLKLQAIDCYTSYLRAEEEIALQDKIIMDEILSLQDVEKSRSIFGKTNCLLLLKLQYEKLIENASQKFSPYTEIQHNKMPVMEHVMECMNISSFQSSVSDDELQDINQLLEVYDAKVDDVEIDANIVDDTDAESDLDS
ncbi:hypothetical protein ACJMK2_030423 [Sinanodonta woodiana]|uniref:CxC2-like cysteine cluster KDZ transposase-associated domain-containing protein n=1 Tax=Sinanodonta woodiana TaxID=1069815 RepID=A0ABD3XD60_SINWO